MGDSTDRRHTVQHRSVGPGRADRLPSGYSRNPDFVGTAERFLTVRVATVALAPPAEQDVVVDGRGLVGDTVRQVPTEEVNLHPIDSARSVRIRSELIAPRVVCPRPDHQVLGRCIIVTGTALVGVQRA